MQTLQIFQPGRHVAASGEAISFTDEQLRTAAAAYDPALHEAPIVVGHPRDDAPAFGWVRSLAYNDGSLEAEPHQLDADFRENVRAGRYKKISASFYRPDAPANPAPGTFYLRHVGFLGAMPPSVKGMRAVDLAEAGDDVVTVEFGEGGRVLADLVRNLREWLIDREGLEQADRILPNFLILDAEEAARTSEPDPETAAQPAFSEHQEREVDPVTKEELERREQEIAAREQQIKDREAQFAEREQQVSQAQADARRARLRASVDAAVQEGRVLPADAEPLVEFMAAVDSDQTVSFGEGDAQTQKPAVEWFSDFLHRLPRRVEFGEHAGDRERGGAARVHASVPQGYTVDPRKAELHAQAVAYAEEHDTDIVTATRAVQGRH
ncbi:MAG: peptidase [Polyangiales bacterium]